MIVLGVIPARGGSKGIVGKNLAIVGRKPLIVHSLEAARHAVNLTDLLVTTDSLEIAELAKANGADPGFLRPPDLATDEAPTILAVQDAVRRWEARLLQKVDAVVLLQPTSPLRTSKDIDGAVDLFLRSGATSLISVFNAAHVHPEIMYWGTGSDGAISLRPVLKGGRTIRRRQEFQPVYVRNGAIYAATRTLVMEQGKMLDDQPIGYEMPLERSLNIDSQSDLELAERAFAKRVTR